MDRSHSIEVPQDLDMNQEINNIDPYQTRSVFKQIRRVGTRALVALGMTFTSVVGSQATEVANHAQIAEAMTNDYPSPLMPCVAQGPNYGKTTGTGYWCDGYQWGDLKTGNQNSSRGFGYRNCTDWAAFRAQELTGVLVPYGAKMGDAGMWDNNAPTYGYTVTSVPEAGDLAVWDGTRTNPYGHVAVVESVNPDGTANISEYNHGMDGNYGTRTSIVANHYIDLNGPNKPAQTVPAVEGPTFMPSMVQRPSGETVTVDVGPNNSLDYYFNALGSGVWGKLATGGQAFSSPAMIQRSNGETDIITQGPNHSLDYYFNSQGSSTWGKLAIAGANAAFSAPAVVQRSNGETDVAVVGPNNSLDFYINSLGSPNWGKLTVPGAQAFSKPAMVQRSSGETDIATLGPDNTLNFYYNPAGTTSWGVSHVAANGWAWSAPSMIQRPTSGETDIAVQGPNNSLDFYMNTQGSPYWGRLPVAASGSTFATPNPPSMTQRLNGETDIVARGPNDTANFFFNTFGTSNWNKVPVATPGFSFRQPAMIQRPNNETDLAVVGPNNRLDFYFNQYGSPYWANFPIAGNNTAS